MGPQRLTGGLIRLPLPRIRERRDCHKFALIEASERYTDHAFHRHDNFLRQLFDRSTDLLREIGGRRSRQDDLNHRPVPASSFCNDWLNARTKHFGAAIHAVEKLRSNPDNRWGRHRAAGLEGLETEVSHFSPANSPPRDGVSRDAIAFSRVSI
jgi:hypothetical protein